MCIVWVYYMVWVRGWLVLPKTSQLISRRMIYDPFSIFHRYESIAAAHFIMLGMMLEINEIFKQGYIPYTYEYWCTLLEGFWFNIWCEKRWQKALYSDWNVHLISLMLINSERDFAQHSEYRCFACAASEFLYAGMHPPNGISYMTWRVLICYRDAAWCLLRKTAYWWWSNQRSTTDTLLRPNKLSVKVAIMCCDGDADTILYAMNITQEGFGLTNSW